MGKRIGGSNISIAQLRDGYSYTEVRLYSATERSAYPLTLLYNFTSGALLSGVDGKSLSECLHGWSQEPSAGRYCTIASARTTGDIAEIATSSWCEQFIASEDGETITTVTLYTRSKSMPALPTSTLTYNFETGAVTGERGDWVTSMEDFTGGTAFALWSTSAIAVMSKNGTGEIGASKWSTPKKIAENGVSPVEMYLGRYSYIFPADEDGIISRSDYLAFSSDVLVVQGGESLDFTLSAAGTGVSYVGVEGKTVKLTQNSIMLGDTASIKVTASYDGGEVSKVISLVKAKAGKDAILYFAWSKSESEFLPCDSNFFMWGSVFGFFGGKMMGSLPLQQWSTNREKLEQLKDDEYCYLWAKLTESGEPFLFTGKTGSKGLTGACTLYQYYASTSSTEQTGGEWSDEMPSISGGKFLWMRTKFVPAGGNADDYDWGTPVVAGSDISLFMANIKELGEDVEQNTASITANANQIVTKVSRTDFNSLGERVGTAETSIQQNAEAIELRATKDEVTSAIEVTEGKIALYVDGSDVRNSAGIVVGQIDDEGCVKITASQILLDGSVSAGSLSSECFSGKEYKVTAGGAISGGNSELDENGNLKGIGFYLGADGILRVNTSIINDSTATNFTIKGGKFDSESLETVTSAEETTRTVSSKAFPTDSSKWYYDKRLVRSAIIDHLSVNNEVDLQSNCNIMLGGKTYVKSNRYDLFSGSSSDIVEFSEEQSIACTISKTYTKTFTNQAIKLNILNGGTLQGYYSWDGYYADENVYVHPRYDWVVTDAETCDTDPGGGGHVPSKPSVGDSYYTVETLPNGKFLVTIFTYKKISKGYWTTEEKWHDGGSVWENLRLSYKRVYVNGEEKALDSWLYIGDGEQTVTLKYEVGYTGSYDGSYTQYRWKDDEDNHRFYCTKSYRIYYRYKYDGRLQFQTTPNLYITVLRTADGELLFAENLTSDTSYGQDDVSITINDTRYLEAGKSYTTWTGADKCALSENNGESGSGNVSSGTFLGTTLSTNDILIINGSTVSVVGEHNLIINGNTYIQESEWDTKTGFSVILMSKIKGVHATDIYRKDGGYGRIGDAGNPFTALYVEFIGNLFPVGSIYMSTRNISPASFLGGTWIPFSGGAGFWTEDVPTDSDGNYNYDGNSNFNGSVESEALPNLKGWFVAQGTDGGSGGRAGCDGSLFQVKYTGTVDGGTSGDSNYSTAMDFNASKYNSVYGDNNPVRPKSYRVYAWRRIN